MLLRHSQKSLTKITDADFEGENLNIIDDPPINPPFKPALKQKNKLYSTTTKRFGESSFGN